jgi:hypothetical protein
MSTMHVFPILHCNGNGERFDAEFFSTPPNCRIRFPRPEVVEHLQTPFLVTPLAVETSRKLIQDATERLRLTLNGLGENSRRRQWLVPGLF